MKKILLLVVTLLSLILLPAQGIRQLWGMTAQGGNHGGGVIFKWDPVSNNLIKRIDLDFSTGSYPLSSLTFNDGKFYGSTASGGKNNAGVLFELNPVTNVYTKKIDLNEIDGRRTVGKLILYNGKFYGMTAWGGAYYSQTPGYGTIFEWDPVTNIYTKKIDFDDSNGIYPYSSLVLFGGKFLGTTTAGGNPFSYGGVIFEWDPITNVFTKKIDFTTVGGWTPSGTLTLSGNKFYGTTMYGGVKDDGTGSNEGTIFEWDPVTNIYTRKIQFNGLNGNHPRGALTQYNGKLYGITESGGIYGSGIIFEWDPAINKFTKKFDFGGAQGANPLSSLTLNGNKFYGSTQNGGNNNVGVLFEWDPASNVYTKKIDFDGNNGAYPDLFNDLILAPPSSVVANGVPGSCKTFPILVINSSNNNQWVAITDEENNAVAEIKANGNNLGVVTASVFINNGKVREDGTGRLYLDRSITLTSQYPQKSAVDIRLYIKGSEYTALKNAHNAFGQTAGINSINDVGIFKIKGGCAPAAANISNLINTTGAAWENDYVLSASINSFTSFYFASKNPCAAPVISAVSASSSSLSPADHQMKNVTINYSATGNCFPITTWLTVTSNEPVSGTGNGDLSPDWIIIDEHHLQLRSERSMSGTGRTYTITVNAKNAFGTYCKKTIKVVVTALSVTLAKTADGNIENGLFDCKVVPNPTSNYFNLQIQSASSEKIEVSLTDISGRLISKWTTEKGETNRFGENLSPGIYTVKLIQGQRQQMLQIVKQ